MTAPDITAAAIEAAARAIHESRATPQAERLPWEQAHHLDRMYGRLLAKAALEAAVPVLLASNEKQVREKVAEELVASAPVASVSGQDLVGPRATLRRHLLLAARRVVGPMTTDEVAAAIKRGAFAACYLDEAGQPIARGSRPAADGGSGAT